MLEAWKLESLEAIMLEPWKLKSLKAKSSCASYLPNLPASRPSGFQASQPMGF